MRPLRTLLLVLPLLLALDCFELIEEYRRASLGNSTSPQASAEVLARIEAVENGLKPAPFEPGTVTLADRMAELGTAGVSIAVVNQGRVEWAKAYGSAHAQDGPALNTLTRFQAASISKPTSALAALTLVDAGVIELGDALNDHLTSWTVPDNELTAVTPPTLAMLLSHTAGFGVCCFFGHAGTPVPTLLQVLDGLPPASEGPIRVMFPPGVARYYSGGGYTVLQQLIEDATGKAFESVLDERVFQPLQMQRSGFDQPLANEPIAAWAHIFGAPQGVQSATYPQLGAAGLWTTPIDLARMITGIQRAIDGEPGAILSQALAQEMVSVQAPDFLRGQGYGWFLDLFQDPSYFYHFGLNIGFASVAVGSIQGGYGAVVMINEMFSNSDSLYLEIVNGIAEVYGWPDYIGL